ncbi:internal virion protein [Xanthomonas phage SB3]|uniref:Internal virion protein n=1 Tax=Xanthomonas phage SB3 TaxID=3117472 RepID=A0ABZ2GY70_9CAUD
MADNFTGVRRQPIQTNGGSLGVSAQAPIMGVQTAQNVPQSAYVASGAEAFRGGMDASFGDGLPEFVGEFFSENINAAKQERRFEGFTRAIQGATTEEIAREQPWYTRIVGQTDYELGAERYNTLAKVADIQTDFINRMPDLRTKSPKVIADMLSQTMKDSMTGSAFADTVMQKSLMEAATSLIGMHTKEHEAWNQANQDNLNISTARKSAQAYQTLMSQTAMLGKNEPLDQSALENLQIAKHSLFQPLVPGKFQSQERTTRVLKTVLRDAVQDGNLYAANAILETGVLNTVDEKTRSELEEMVTKGEEKFRTRFATEDEEFVEMYARYRAGIAMGKGGQPSLEEGMALNQYYKAKTGSAVPVLKDDQLAYGAGDSMKNWLSDYHRVQDRQFAAADRAADREAVERAKAAAEERNIMALTRATAGGGAGAAKRMANVSSTDVDRAGLQNYRQLRSVGKDDLARGQLVWNFSTRDSDINPEIQKDTQQGVRMALGEQINDAFLGQYREWLALTQSKGMIVDPATGQVEASDDSAGPATAAAYFGQYHEQFKQFDMRVKGGMDRALAYRSTFGEAAQDGRIDTRGVDSAETKENQKALKAELDNMDDSFLSRVFGDGYKLHPSTRQELSEIGARDFGTLGGMGLLPKDKARQAINMRKAAGRVEFGGSFLWRNGTDQQPVSAFLGDPDGKLTSKLFMEEVEARAKAGGVKDLMGGSVSVTRGPDVNGEPVIQLITWGETGVIPIRVSGGDLKRRNTRMQEQVSEGKRFQRSPQMVQEVWQQDLFNASDK